jgi:excisionase family DNA binding protein
MSLSERFVRQLVATGELPCVRVGDRVLIRPSDIADFIEQRIDDRRQSRPPPDHCDAQIERVEARTKPA